ncbi:MAG: hypothetical protein K2O67_02665 [Clostridia bacterium]|nr:hypothetical protein [Clostridia bacterium]
MPKKKILIFIAIIVIICIALPITAAIVRKTPSADATEMQQISIWQIDGFEGGKGSRANYIQKTGEKCFKNKKIYVTVTVISADAARLNIERGEYPDIISYPAGFYGLENLINTADFSHKTWCNGSYCLLTLEENSQFSDVLAQNTVVNMGKDNLTEVALALSGLNGAVMEEPTNAYLKLLSGKYKYLFGSQRDVFRLKARNVSFSIKPVTEFNDLYQNISILAKNKAKYQTCKQYVDYLLSNSNVGSLGLFGGGELCAEELKVFEGINYGVTLNCPCGINYVNDLKAAAKNGDVNKLKTLLK